MASNIEYNENLQQILNQIKRGAFLTVKANDEINTMTIGWATFGIIWNKPVLMVMVRPTRHTFGIIEKARDFTVSIPVNVDLKKALAFCGSYSGRDVDKIKEAKLSVKKGKISYSPIIKECDYHYECRILFSQPMDASKLDESIISKNYPARDYHTLYIGEILESYTT